MAMSRRSWNVRYSSLALWTVAVVLWSGSIWVISAQQAYQSNYAKYDARYASEDASKIINEVCLTAPTAEEKIECLERVVNPEREYRQSAADLKAQQNMAQWTAAMVGVAIMQTLAAIGGTVLLVGTFHQGAIQAHAAQRGSAKATIANINAREIGRKQTRAYLTCSGGSYEISGNWFYINLTIKNVGQSPAISARTRGEIDVIDISILDGSRTRYKGNAIPDEGRRIASGEQDDLTLVICAGDMEPVPNFADFAVPLMEVDVQVWLSWTDVFGDEQRIVIDLYTDVRNRSQKPNSLKIRDQIEWKDKFPSDEEENE